MIRTLVVLYFCFLLPMVTGFEAFQKQIPNGDKVPDPCIPGQIWKGVGHLVPGGKGRRNPFGEDFARNGKKWSVDLCQLDSDRDGLTNGEELGDPGCSWTPGMEPLRTTQLSHPGICDPWNSTKCQNKNAWLGCGNKGLSCDIIKDPETKNVTFHFPTTQVPPVETSYYCMMFDLPQEDNYHLVATEPVIDNQDVVHHILLFGCEPSAEIRTPTGPYRCNMLAHRKCLEIIGTWTIGSPGECFHKNVGFKIGKTGYRKAALQIHWNNPKKIANYNDSSGMRLYYTNQLRPNDAGFLLVGQEYLEIPPRPQSHPTMHFSSVCPERCTSRMFTGPIYITSAINHMHYLGVSQRIELFRNRSKVRDITHDKAYHYDSPVIYTYNPPIEFFPGDEMHTTCEYRPKTSGKPVCFGDGTQDEMCYGFITYYPIHNLVRPWCTTRKTVQTCDRDIPELRNRPIDGCHWLKFLNQSNPETVNIFKDVMKKCMGSSVEGYTCTNECFEAIASAREHPCLTGDIGCYVISKFRHSYIGVMFLNALMTCDCEGKYHVGYCARRLRGGMLGGEGPQACALRNKIPSNSSPARTLSFCSLGVCVVYSVLFTLLSHSRILYGHAF